MLHRKLLDRYLSSDGEHTRIDLQGPTGLISLIACNMTGGVCSDKRKGRTPGPQGVLSVLAETARSIAMVLFTTLTSNTEWRLVQQSNSCTFWAVYNTILLCSCHLQLLPVQSLGNCKWSVSADTFFQEIHNEQTDYDQHRCLKNAVCHLAGSKPQLLYCTASQIPCLPASHTKAQHSLIVTTIQSISKLMQLHKPSFMLGHEQTSLQEQESLPWRLYDSLPCTTPKVRWGGWQSRPRFEAAQGRFVSLGQWW